MLEAKEIAFTDNDRFDGAPLVRLGYEFKNYTLLSTNPFRSIHWYGDAFDFRNSIQWGKDINFDYTGKIVPFTRTELKTFLIEDINKIPLENTERNRKDRVVVTRAAELIGGYDNLLLFNSLKPIKLMKQLSKQEYVSCEDRDRIYLTCKLKINYLQEDGATEKIEKIIRKYNDFLESSHSCIFCYQYTLT